MILNTDSYKLTHWLQFPPEMTQLTAYFEARGGEYPATVFCGLQPHLRKLFGQRVSMESVNYAEDRVNKHLGPGYFNRAGWERIVREYHGYAPLAIHAVPEGSLVPVGNVLFKVRSRDPQFGWLASYVETLLEQVWYPCTVATRSYSIKQVIKRYLEQTAEVPDADYMLHDFGYRGVSSEESAGFGGVGHLLSFTGSDNLQAIEDAQQYYACDMAGHSIPAMEHNTIIAWGQDREEAAYRNAMEKIPTGPLSMVLDSYDYWHALEHILGGTLHDEVLKREGVIIPRGDSGEPVDTVLRSLGILAAKFGARENSKGYDVLNPKVRFCWSNKNTEAVIQQILQAMLESRWSAENIVFGMGGALLQEVSRDTSMYAYKACEMGLAGGTRAICKHPVDAPFKNSKAGDLMLYRSAAKVWRTGIVGSLQRDESTMLHKVFDCGGFINETTLDEARARLSKETYVEATI